MRLKATILTIMIATMTMAQSVIDVHNHIITPEYLAALGDHNALLDEGFPLPQWNVEDELAFMDSCGIGCSVLTMCAPHPYFGNSRECADVVRRVNEQALALRSRYPGRFKVCAALPLPDVTAAIAEAKYMLDEHHADGIKLATNHCGQYLGDSALDPLMEVLNERNAVVILHPHRPEPVNAEVMAQTPLAMQEYLSETTRAVANMITRNTPARYPNIKFVIPHCGAYLPLSIPRMKSLYPVMKANGLVGEIDFDRGLASFYYDLAGSHSPEVIKMMLSITTPEHILYGSDYPYVAAPVLKAQFERMKQYLADDPQLRPYAAMFLSENAARLFGDDYAATQPDVSEDTDMIVRIAEIEVYEQYLGEYLAAAKRVGGISVEREPGVVCIFPMQVKDDPCKVRIVEIYRNQDAYQSHLKTDHFLQYKQGTLHMVKSLRLVDTTPLDPEAMNKIFLKQY